MNNRPRIIVSCPPGIPPFAALDAKLLSAEFDIDIYPVSGMRSLVRLRHALKSADGILIWFLGRHSMPAVTLACAAGIPIVSVIGGFEVAWVRGLGYGIRPGSVKNRVLRWMIASSESVISVSKFSLGEAQARFPDMADKFLHIPNAVDTSRFTLPIHGDRAGVVSAGAVTRETIGRKSWQLFLDTARKMPNESFSIAGVAADAAGESFISDMPANVRWLGGLGQPELVDIFQRSRVYAQLSIYESFGVALAEAMSCGCFPVVSSRGALPEVVGREGVVVSDLTPTAVEVAIRAALNRPEAERANVRARIEANFALEQRRKLLSGLFQKILSS